jgi:hypothetical protein
VKNEEKMKNFVDSIFWLYLGRVPYLEKSRNNVENVIHNIQGLSYISKKEISSDMPKKNKMTIMIHVRLHLMGCQDCGHMTNFLKW